MENEISTNLDAVVKQEKALNDEISDKEYDATRALEDLYNSIEKLYSLRNGTREVLVGVDDFIKNVRAKYVGVNIESFEQRKNDIVNLLDNISWSVREAIDKINKFEADVKKIGE